MMLERNIFNVVRLKVDDTLPRFALEHLKSLGSDQTAQPLPCELVIRNGFSNRQVAKKKLRLDLCQVAENFLEWKAQYKFSHWQYRLYRNDDFHYDLELCGDWFSQWVWPYRTVAEILQILLWKAGYLRLHAAGFYNGRHAVLVMAASGTGKTLTTLHFLCRGGKVYNDDTVTLFHDNVLPTLKKISFWEYRYRNHPEVLPDKMPVFSAALRKKQRFYKFCNQISMGYLSLGEPIPVKEYWPECMPPEAPVKKIIVLKKGPVFRQVRTFEKTECLNRLTGDLTFQGLPLLRIAEIETLTGFTILNAGLFFQDHQRYLNEQLLTLPFTLFEVPSVYSHAIFDRLYQEIMA